MKPLIIQMLESIIEECNNHENVNVVKHHAKHLLRVAEKQSKSYLVYCNKTSNTWLRDAYSWLDQNGYTKDDFEMITSEVTFQGILENKPVDELITATYIREIITEH